jgi:hypothetical protein
MIGINLVRSPKWLDSSDTGQDLTFEEICPIWSDKLRKGLELQDKYVLTFDSKYCLVGEAWGFTGKQAGYYIAPLMPVLGCWTCVKYGRKFGTVAKNKECSSKDFEPLISEFLVHWNQKHKTITKVIKEKSKLN